MFSLYRFGAGSADLSGNKVDKDTALCGFIAKLTTNARMN